MHTHSPDVIVIVKSHHFRRSVFDTALKLSGRAGIARCTAQHVAAAGFNWPNVIWRGHCCIDPVFNRVAIGNIVVLTDSERVGENKVSGFVLLERAGIRTRS